MTYQINWDEIRPEDLPGDLGEIAQDCDMEVVQYLVEMWGGAMIYIPTLSKLKKERRDHLIVQDYDGSNVGKLASRYGVSRRYVSRVIRDQSEDDAGD
jgi:Mor family transcriptional regulator